MPKAHEFGPLFVQVTKFPYDWGNKVIVRGWTQEIEEPFRTSKPFIVRLPAYKALVFGRWTGVKTEEEALNRALEAREAKEDEFMEEKGWVPAPNTDREASVENLYPRFNSMDGALDVYDWQVYYGMAKESERHTS